MGARILTAFVTMAVVAAFVKADPPVPPAGYVYAKCKIKSAVREDAAPGKPGGYTFVFEYEKQETPEVKWAANQSWTYTKADGASVNKDVQSAEKLYKWYLDAKKGNQTAEIWIAAKCKPGDPPPKWDVEKVFTKNVTRNW